jgi:hypothetical protein
VAAYPISVVFSLDVILSGRQAVQDLARGGSNAF